MKRAIRRHHLARMKAKAKRCLVGWSQPEQAANHMAICSCYMCGNPRKYDKKRTWQEIKFIKGLVAEW